jgi:phosphomannomutase/phosphoglucomutase
MDLSRIPLSIFREYDIRGIAEKDLSAEFAHRLGLAYVSYLGDRRPAAGRRRLKISVGRDCRLSSDPYAMALIRGLLQSGVDVVDLGVCPTPLTYFSIFHLDLDGGIMVTGSHNPADYNGFKICVGRDTLHGHQIQDLKRLVLDPALALRDPGEPGELESYRIIPAYVDKLASLFGKFAPKKVVLDAGNGTAATVAPAVFERLGANVVPLFCELDGRFPNHHPDPTVPANLKALVEAVRRESADFGVAFDGDSDRIGLVDESGRILYGDELMVVFSREVLRKNPGATIISEVKSSNRLYNDIARRGGKPLMWKTGHSLIKTKMKETGALLAGEMSGHVFFADRYYGYDDAIYAAARVYEIACATEGPISRTIADLPPSVSTPEIRVECVEAQKFELVEETKRQLGDAYPCTAIDGVRVDFGDAWGLVRASNTQPVLVLRFEAPSQNRLLEIRTLFESALFRAARIIGHPPVSLSSLTEAH